MGTEMAVTVCECENFWEVLRPLKKHVKSEGSDLVILPEMPASGWLPAYREFDEGLWDEALQKHKKFVNELRDFPTAILSTMPVEMKGKRLNAAFLFDKDLRILRYKYYLPNIEGFYEANWFDRMEKDFSVYGFGNAHFGVIICTELMFNEWARFCGRKGAHFIAVPRATGKGTVERWLIASRMAAIVSGSYVLSSNRKGGIFDGCGWVVSPEGDVIAITSEENPFLTVSIDLKEAEEAKSRYPRNVPE